MKPLNLLCIVLCSCLVSCAKHSITVFEENDAIKIGRGTDANYTQGLSVVLSETEAYNRCDSGWPGIQCEVATPAKRFINAINLLESNSPEKEIYLRYGLAQQFYTPNDISIPEVIEDDRPYAGWLHLSLDIDNHNFNGSDWAGDVLNTVKLRIGVVGPAAFAKEVQTWYHDDVCDCTHPEGWDNQIKNEPGFIYSLKRDKRQAFGEWRDHWRADFITMGEASIGNVYTGIDVGGQIRFGYNIPRSFYNMNIGPVSYGLPCSGTLNLAT